MNYRSIKTLAKEQKLSVRDLIILAPQNDPFYVGTDTDEAMAQWFAELWERFGYGTGVHLRRVHYHLVSQENPRKHDGKAYENTVADWQYLCSAGKHARYLGVVPVEAFVDRRNPEPHIYAYYGEGEDYVDWTTHIPEWELPEIPKDISLPLPFVTVHGYKYSLSDQPYHVELWVEKSTMNDAIMPVCSRYGVNLVTGLGEMSITAVRGLLERVQDAGKPTRIFYVSDFDPAGYGMPTSVARKIEFMLSEQPIEDIKLQPIVLTRQQVREYSLPRTPIKESERRKDTFEEIHGEGAVELDALEALYPGALSEIIETEILHYRDTALESRLSEQENEAHAELTNAFQRTVGPYLSEMEQLRDEAKTILARYQRFNDEMNALRERIEALRQRIIESVNEIDVDLPDRECAEVQGDTHTGWLYDSNRGYIEQLRTYKEHKLASGE